MSELVRIVFKGRTGAGKTTLLNIVKKELKNLGYRIEKYIPEDHTLIVLTKEKPYPPESI